MGRRYYHYGLCVIAASLWAGCLSDAPHENPLDPRSDDFEAVGTLTIQATRFYPPFEGVAQANVALTQAAPGSTFSMVAQTDAGGTFVASMQPGRYRLRVEKAGFAEATDTIEVQMGEPVEAALRLDALPLVLAPRVTTTHISRWWPQTDSYQLDIDVTVDDPDGLADVDRVWLSIPDLSRADTLLITQQPGRYVEVLPAERLGITSLHELLGLSLYVVVRDRAGAESRSEPLQLVRLIEAVPVAASPQGRAQVTTPTPELRWEPIRLPFAFTYRVDVVRVESNIEIPVQTIDDLPASQTAIRVPEALEPGEYYWTVSVVDAFGNRSRSKEAGFVLP